MTSIAQIDAALRVRAEGTRNYVGIAAASLAVAVLGTLKRWEGTPMQEASRALSVVPITGIAFFAILFAIAVVQVKRPDVHKRLLVVALPAGLQGAIAPPPVAVSILPGLVAMLLAFAP